MTELTPPRCAKHDRTLTVCAECYTPPRDTTDTEALAVEYLLASCPECDLLLRAHNQYRWGNCRRTRDEATVLWLATRDAALRAEALREAATVIEDRLMGGPAAVRVLRERADRIAAGGAL